MKIGIDIDDTICDTFTYILPVLCEYYHFDSKKILEDKINNNYIAGNFKNYATFARTYYPNIIPYVPLIKDSKKYINKLSKDNEIYFITSRSTLGFDNSYKMSYEYLTKSKINFNKLIVAAGNKYQVCKDLNIDIFIDDSVNNCLAVAKNNKIDVILFGNKYNKNNVLNKMDSWEQIYNYITRNSNTN